MEEIFLKKKSSGLLISSMCIPDGAPHSCIKVVRGKRVVFNTYYHIILRLDVLYVYLEGNNE